MNAKRIIKRALPPPVMQEAIRGPQTLVPQLQRMVTFEVPDIPTFGDIDGTEPLSRRLVHVRRVSGGTELHNERLSKHHETDRGCSGVYETCIT